MLYVFDPSLILININSHIHIRALENLLGAYQSRQHLVFSPMKELRALSSLVGPHLSAPSRAMLQTMLNNAVEQKQFVDSLEYKVVVFIDSARPQISRNGKVWHVSLDFIADSGILQSAFIGENELDAQLFLLLAELYRIKYKFRGYGIRGRPKGGGGSTLPGEIETYLKVERSPCLSISDSDKFHPNADVSDTVKKCTKIVQEQHRIVEYIWLEEREVENLLPWKILEKIVDVSTFLDACDGLFARNPTVLPYADLKHGVGLRWIKCRDVPTRKFWQTVENGLERNMKSCMTCKGSMPEGDLTCRCTHIGGFGPALLDKCVNYIKENSMPLVLRLFDEDLRWEPIGKVAFNFAVNSLGERSV